MKSARPCTIWLTVFVSLVTAIYAMNANRVPLIYAEPLQRFLAVTYSSVLLSYLVALYQITKDGLINKRR